jgi:twitching motility protein PilT
MARIDELLSRMPTNGASDLHMVAGEHPKFALHGEVTEIDDWEKMSNEFLRATLLEILSPEQQQLYLERWDLDHAYAIPGVARYRCNYYHQRTGHAAVFRIIPSKILTLEQLKMPEAVKKFVRLRAGMVLVTGPTGSGKTTTLAAIINEINLTQRRRMITIEDPVEFVHPNKMSIISHREVHTHTESFANALRAVTRQDCDVVLVGELRDLETMKQALSAAAMGTLVFGTLHTNSAAKTVDRIIDMFPSDQQAQVRTMLAESLRGIVAQQLLRTKDGKGRVAAVEILVGNTAVSSIIREGKIERIPSVLQSGRREGMQIMDDALEQYVKEGVIDGKAAYMKANEKKRFEQYVEGEALE